MKLMMSLIVVNFVSMNGYLLGELRMERKGFSKKKKKTCRIEIERNKENRDGKSLRRFSWSGSPAGGCAQMLSIEFC